MHRETSPAAQDVSQVAATVSVTAEDELVTGAHSFRNGPFRIAVVALLAGFMTGSVEAASLESATILVTPKSIQDRVFDQEVKPNWLGVADRFWYRYRTGQGAHYWLVDARAKSKSSLAAERDLLAAVSRLLPGAPPASGLTVANFAVSNDDRMLEFTVGGYRFQCDAGNCQPRIIGRTPTSIEDLPQASRSPDEKFTVFVRDHNLFAVDASGKQRQLTFDGELNRSFAIDPEAVHDGRKSSPVVWLGGNSSKFYVQRWDMRHVADEYALSAVDPDRPTLLSWKKALAGDASVQRHELWVIDARTGQRTAIKAEKWPDQMIGHADIGGGFGRSSATGIFPISGNDRQLHFVRIARGYKARDLAIADTVTGEVRTLISETDPVHIDIRYAELGSVQGSGELIWLTQRNGWKHLALHDQDGRFKNWITAGAFVVDRILKVDAERREVYFAAAGREKGENPHQIHTYRVGLDGAGLTLLDPGNAHRMADGGNISPAFTYLVDNFSRPDLPSRSTLRDRSGAAVIELETTDTSALAAMGWIAPEPFVVRSADGTTALHGAMFKPSNFDSRRRYPMIVDVYPGPGSNATFPLDFNPAHFRNHAFPQALAERGFIVVQPSNRGSSTFRHRDFALLGYGNPRDFPMPDLHAAVHQLKAAHAFIDADRIGISGYSGGGLMSVTAMLTYPDLFKVGVAGAGNHDPNIYEQNSNEYHFGIPPVGKPEARRFFETNAQLAHRLRGRLLLIHGDQDRDVILAHSLRLAAALNAAKKPYDMLITPGLGHGALFEDPSYFEAVAGYFVKHLKP